MKVYSGADTIREQLPDILHDESRYQSGVPGMVFYPEMQEELLKAIHNARNDGQKITFIGAQTGTTGGAVPEEGNYAICFSAFNKIREVTIDAGTGLPILWCDPGVTLDKIDAFLKSPLDWPYRVSGSEILRQASFLYPPDPTEMTAQLGGTVATNASGARSYYFGATRSHVASLDLVFSSGHTATVRRSGTRNTVWNRKLTTNQGLELAFPELPYSFTKVKNASGYYQNDLMEPIDLFIGSEGTLAAISGIAIYLQPVKPLLSGLSFFPTREAAFDFADYLREIKQMAAIEYFDEGSLRFIDKYRNRMPDKFPSFPDSSTSAVLWEYFDDGGDSFESIADQFEKELVGCSSSFDDTWSGFDDKEKERLHHFRHALPETVNSIIAENKRTCSAIRKIGTDSAFPAASFRASFDEMMRLIKENRLVHAAFGHLGNYHIHVNLVPSNSEELSRSLSVYDQMMELAIREKGTVSAEHGIGKIKSKYLLQMYGSQAIDKMRRIRSAADPLTIFNPGNLF